MKEQEFSIYKDVLGVDSLVYEEKGRDEGVVGLHLVPNELNPEGQISREQHLKRCSACLQRIMRSGVAKNKLN
ncbi:hypothetical protein A3I27_04075 [Candidatus Giovannonibacteria bacterium RIFCSPLOWO2_02_FULL_43_11b]|uniref:Uncharacterized protein n=1 Tax=Candidatus Giovannonibacteria bacterium RIFCSPHIGHO2_12_FULL_43_15 TaxID=1798341 RepID=A0A1F5WQK0_9BACT|nr:MAG: hypothetical protein A2739_02640 [Candidatus Giovannonibacteria bacterium RIFCSPHIGHO2_01_FULL_43_100]OGF67107.1 MAG: hypothetical protein A3B97_04190 [Candidatus Giovannonibacteria bacterium RIFCSPHIGHO2_02_FULL_43_32]OGF77953.1 MAG: hypothetical protein A3F23_03890 [Candidatus Giovannonibacteria bacterium RIFCSPHIGHO2_12_FULL_43_15]OGF79305.1 MAG: hypothetical protein A3A15_01535 [Candidatus Giovannonibacteria bacterium RIFCSPLOWO2_01_FULL_43_60]OGF89282.1 MAG: hypothetical protein A3